MVVVFLLGTAAAAAAYRASFAVPFFARNLHVIVAGVFLYLPAAILFRRRADFAAYGFTLRPLLPSLGLAAVLALAIFPAFALGLYGYERVVCAPGSPLGALALPGECARFALRPAHPFAALLRGPAMPALELAFAELVAVALPEEFFFRGYLMGRLEEAYPPRRRLAGGGIGLALFLQAALFALGHFLVDFDPRRLAVFFPGLLFGWMRSRTRGIVAGTTFHASCNLLMEALHRIL